MAFFHVAYVDVTRNSALVLFEEAPPDFPLNGAFLWHDAGPAPFSPELVVRSMWLSLVTKALEQRWPLEVQVDETGLLTGITVLSPESGDRITIPRDAGARAELFEELRRRAVEAPA